MRLSSVVLYTVLITAMLGCGSGGGGNDGNQAKIPPTGLSYPITRIQARLKEPIPLDTPTLLGEGISFEVTPNLPPGISLNPNNGVIQGTPLVVCDTHPYVVVARNAFGATSASLQIGVDFQEVIPALFAPAEVFYGEAAAEASIPVGTGRGIVWDLANETARGSILGLNSISIVAFRTDEPVGPLQLSVSFQGADQLTHNLSRTVEVVGGKFLKDPRTPLQRFAQSATLMQDGRVIVTGGQFNKHFNFIFQQSDFLTSTEIFDPATNTWAMAGNMQVGRSAHTTTLLPNGKVLVVGGTDGTNALSDAELLDPITRVWTKTGPMLVARARHQTTLLSDGKVLISGGNDLINSAGMKSCELFDPTTNLFSATGDMKAFHDMDSTVLMGDGRVLAGSGYIWEAYNPQTREWTSLSGGPGGGVMGLLNDGRVIAIGTEMAVSLFEPATNTWTDAGSSGLDRWDGYSVTVLKNGKVLVVGGLDHGFAPLVQADLYDPIARTWSRAGALNLPRSGHDALALVDGRVLITSGGEVAGGELYDPTSNTWSMSGIEATQRYNHTSTRLLDGRVLVAGGDGWSGWASSSVFDPVSSTWKTAGNMAGSRSSHTATLLGNGKVLVTGGLDTAILPLATAELFDPGTGNWSSAGSMQTARWLHTSTLLPDGRVMVTGGSPDTWASSACGSVEIYDPVTNLWKQAADMSGPRVAHAAALLPSGHVLVAGCGANMNTSSTYSTAESYDPITNTWSAAASPQFSRYGAAYTAVPLRDGKVLFIGGDGSRTDVQGYDPVLDKWTQAASPIAPHNQWFTASLLPDGKVLLVGGTPETHSLLDAAEVYDPVLDLWLSTGSLVSARSLHTATLLNDGRVMVVGGINGYIPEFWKP